MRTGFAAAAVVVTIFLSASAAQAAAVATAGDGKANPDGSATVPVTITCSPGARVLEAHLTLSQDEQTIWGMAGIANVRCTGRPRTYAVTVRPYDGNFHLGVAFASPYILVEDRRTGTTESGGTFSVIELR